MLLIVVAPLLASSPAQAYYCCPAQPKITCPRLRLKVPITVRKMRGNNKGGSHSLRTPIPFELVPVMVVWSVLKQRRANKKSHAFF
jgi:hypothetical protein